MDLPLEGIADPLVLEEPRRESALEGAVEALGPTAEQRRRVGDNDRRALGRAHHRAADRTLGVEQQRADRVGVLARLAAEFVEPPAPVRRQPRHTDRLEHGWAWRIPLPGRVSMGLVIDSQFIRKFGETPEQQLDAYLRHDKVIRDFARPARRITPVVTYTNYQSRATRGVG